MTGRARHSILLLDRPRTVCPEDDPSRLVALTVNVALSIVLYADPDRARPDLVRVKARLDKAQPDLWLHILVCHAACAR